MNNAAEPILLADIGGTNARLTVAEHGRFRPAKNYAVADFPGPADVIRTFLGDSALMAVPGQAILALAGPVEGGHGRLTNGVWQFDAEALAGELGLSRVTLVNDFAALAHGLPHFTAKDLCRVGGGDASEDAPSVVIGPGTGLGTAAFVPVDGGVVLATEGGHVTLPAEDGREAEILAILRDRYGYVSAERVLSGSGLELLYDVLHVVDGSDGPAHRSAGEITGCALAGSCATCLATLQTFCAMLGTFAGNAALTIGARGGVYIAGGIVPRFTEFLAKSDFRERFEAKGRSREWLSGIPTFVITHPDPAFPGLMAMLNRVD